MKKIEEIGSSSIGKAAGAVSSKEGIGAIAGGVGGGAADDAGLQGGDIIIALSGQSITNIYDYTYALDLLRVDEPVQVVYTRDGERMEAELGPEARR